MKKKYKYLPSADVISTYVIMCATFVLGFTYICTARVVLFNHCNILFNVFILHSQAENIACLFAQKVRGVGGMRMRRIMLKPFGHLGQFTYLPSSIAYFLSVIQLIEPNLNLPLAEMIYNSTVEP